ncbi:ferredoxin reductase [Haloechinothrix sp. LS1_15]|uniref:ferredoxin reductase n=1 Tax=Haloechinothrix sp. LS1_15 TaxID=2652248 RepID=UPI0029442BE4|nr:ferredoxin reductase [Haloechinothrix sp. LS1_15]MDV6012765.1 ferredoxin reductase [Haloechinothrix sp. LS1_15]
MADLIPRRRSLRETATSLAGALLTPHGIDRYLELVHPMLVRSELRGEVVAVRRQTPDTVTLTVRTSRSWQGFRAGQYVRVSVDIDGVRRTRCYSPANSQLDPRGALELTIKADPNGLVSSYLHRHAAPGMILGLSQPDGEFTLPEPRPRKMVLISGGSGITPVLSMLRTLCDQGQVDDVVFVHYANTGEDVLYREELAELDRAHPELRVALGYTHAETGADLHGFFTREHLDEVAPWWRHAETYLCGPDGLMDAVRSLYDAEGLGEQLHTEVFTPPELEIDTENATGEVRFTHSGREISNTGRPLLEQAEVAGLRPEHGCRMGICFSCTQVKSSGCVRNALTGELSSEPDEEIQMCISVPVGDVDICC